MRRTNNKTSRTLSREILKEVYAYYKENPGIDWPTLAEYFNKKHNLAFGESAYRKHIQIFERMMEALEISQDETIMQGVYLTKELKMHALIKKNQALLKELKALKDEVVSRETLEELYMSSIPAGKPPKIAIKNTLNSVDRKSVLFVISDMQEDGSGFSLSVYEKVSAEIVKRIKNEKLKEVYILENGDAIDGVLRTSDLYTNPGGIVLQLQHYKGALAALLETISQYALVKFSIVNSNHTEIRPNGTSRGQVKEEDVTIDILNYLKAYLRENSNIEWLNGDVSNPLQLNNNYFQVQGYNVHQSHGDLAYSNPKNAEGFYNRLIRFFNRDIDLVIVAHWHHFVAKTINRLPEKGGDSIVVYSPALDPRVNKQNEMSIMVSSEPSFLRIDIIKDKGITKYELIRTNYKIS